ncbi:uncharacterized protein [Ptychodera flava]|uniref:uncharacterized protein n=1 Tax=Ptychodera flava TaxID=63121 RepID=UPI003969C478
MFRQPDFEENELLDPTSEDVTFYTTGTIKVLDNNECAQASRGFNKRYLAWFILTAILLVIGLVLLTVNTGVALYCLQQYGFSTAICDIKSAKFPALDEMRSVAETSEPVISVLVVASALVFTYNPTLSGTECCNCQIGQNFSKLGKMFKKYWFTTYLVMLMISYGYHVIVFALDVKVRWEGALRYISLPLGLTAWFIWMVALNEHGAMTTVARKQCGCQELPSIDSVHDDNRNSHIAPGLSKLYMALLLFAGTTNIVEFLIYTVYVTGSFTTISTTEKNRLLWYFDFLCMTLTAALRYAFASFYFQMAYIGEKKYQQMIDPWEKVGAARGVEHNHLTYSNA